MEGGYKVQKERLHIISQAPLPDWPHFTCIITLSKHYDKYWDTHKSTGWSWSTVYLPVTSPPLTADDKHLFEVHRWTISTQCSYTTELMLAV